MNKFEITFDEQYQLIKLYDLLRDTGMIDDLPKEIETFFDKLLDYYEDNTKRENDYQPYGRSH